jgi:hypothetical protein
MKKIAFALALFTVTSAQAESINGIDFLDSLVKKPSDHAILDSLQIHRKNAAGALLGMDAINAVLNKPIIFHDGKMMVTYRFPDALHAIVKVDDKMIRANIMQDVISHKICFDYRGKAPSFCSSIEYSPGKFTFRDDATHALDAMVMELGK